ncbi:unnamed protein product [Phaeothamnion confervicola]
MGRSAAAAATTVLVMAAAATVTPRCRAFAPLELVSSQTLAPWRRTGARRVALTAEMSDVEREGGPGSSVSMAAPRSLSSARAGPSPPTTSDPQPPAEAAPAGASSSSGATLYEEASRYADPRAVATECIIEVTSEEHFDHIVGKAAGGDPAHDGYVDGRGQKRQPHALIVVEVYANWCRACIGLRPKLLKLCAVHPEVLCCKINKSDQGALADRLGVKGLPTLILYKGGRRVDHFTTADRDTIEEAIADNT